MDERARAERTRVRRGFLVETSGKPKILYVVSYQVAFLFIRRFEATKYRRVAEAVCSGIKAIIGVFRSKQRNKEYNN